MARMLCLGLLASVLTGGLIGCGGGTGDLPPAESSAPPMPSMDKMKDTMSKKK